MCDKCDDKVLNMILDYMLLGLHLEVASVVVRDSITQSSLRMAATDQAAIDDIRHFTVLVAVQTQNLRDMSDDQLRGLIIERAVLAAVGH